MLIVQAHAGVLHAHSHGAHLLAHGGIHIIGIHAAAQRVHLSKGRSATQISKN
jgi:hypothetical protein